MKMKTINITTTNYKQIIDPKLLHDITNANDKIKI